MSEVQEQKPTQNEEVKPQPEERQRDKKQVQ